MELFNFTTENTSEFITNESDFRDFHESGDHQWYVNASNTAFPSPLVLKTSLTSRAVTDTLQAPFRFICKLILHRKEGVFGGTGFLISKRHVLTAGHCILPGNSREQTESIEVIPGLIGNTMPFGSQMSSELQVASKWRKRKRPFDYGLIQLPDETLFNRVKGHFFLRPPKKKATVSGGGYADLPPFGEENPLGRQIQTQGKVLKVRRNIMTFNNPLKVGYSGGPLYQSQEINGERYFFSHGLGTYLYRSGNIGPRVNKKMLEELNDMVKGSW
jgi:V8-like Glu-specific endopeptidase